VEPDGFGELCLGELALGSEGGESFGEVHRECEQGTDLLCGYLT
jgi:hypothetical protein